MPLKKTSKSLNSIRCQEEDELAIFNSQEKIESNNVLWVIPVDFNSFPSKLLALCLRFCSSFEIMLIIIKYEKFENFNVFALSVTKLSALKHLRWKPNF